MGNKRRFIAENDFVKNLVKSFGINGIKIEQYFVKTGKIEEGYRCVNGQYYHTIKHNSNFSSKKEHHKICSRSEFENNKQYKVGNVIERTKYLMTYEEFNLEVDVYRGALSGLSICRVNFRSAKEANDFKIPNICGQEITNEAAYDNVHLAINGLPNDMGNSI